MKYFNGHVLSVALVAALAAPAAAQQQTKVATLADPKTTTTTAAPAPAIDTPATKPLRYAAPPIEIQHYRPQDRRGLNVFESPKEEGAAYTGFKLSWGAAFTQQYQSLKHSNTAAEKIDPVTKVNANKLIEIGSGFNNAVANLYMNAQLARGRR